MCTQCQISDYSKRCFCQIGHPYTSVIVHVFRLVLLSCSVLWNCVRCLDDRALLTFRMCWNLGLPPLQHYFLVRWHFAQISHALMILVFLCFQPFLWRDLGSALQICSAWLLSTVLAGEQPTFVALHPLIVRPTWLSFAWGCRFCGWEWGLSIRQSALGAECSHFLFLLVPAWGAETDTGNRSFNATYNLINKAKQATY